MDYSTDYPIERLVYPKKSMFFAGIDLPAFLSADEVLLSCYYSIRNTKDSTQVLTNFSANIIDGKVLIDSSVLEQLNGGNYILLLMYNKLGKDFFCEKKRLKIEDF